MCNAEHHDLHSPLNITMKTRLAGSGALMEEEKNYTWCFGGKT